MGSPTSLMIVLGPRHTAVHLLTYHLCLICAASNLLAKVKYLISLTILIVLLLILKHNKCQEKQYVSRKPLQQCCWFVVVVVAAVDISPRGLAPQRDAARPCFFVAAPPRYQPGRARAGLSAGSWWCCWPGPGCSCCCWRAGETCSSQPHQ